MSSLSNYNTNNTRSVTLIPFFLALSLKIYSILKSLIRGIRPTDYSLTLIVLRSSTEHRAQRNTSPTT